MSMFRNRWILGAMRRLAIANAALLPASFAAAHSLHVNRGGVVIRGETLTLEVETTVGQLIRDHGAKRSESASFSADDVAATATSRGRELARGIVVRNGAGETMVAQTAEVSFPTDLSQRLSADDLQSIPVRCTFFYELSASDSHVSFQLAPDTPTHDSAAGLALAVEVNETRRSAIRLTGGGNVEVVSISDVQTRTDDASGATQSETTDCGADAFVLRDAHTSVRAIVGIEREWVHLDLFIPSRILESWSPISRADNDFIDANEQSNAARAFAAFARDRLHVTVGELARLGHVRTAEFLRPGETTAHVPARAGSHGLRRVSAWTSRLHVGLDFAVGEPDARFEIEWGLYNARVLTAHALVVAGGDCVEVDFSTYARRWTWPPKSPPIRD